MYVHNLGAQISAGFKHIKAKPFSISGRLARDDFFNIAFVYLIISFIVIAIVTTILMVVVTISMLGNIEAMQGHLQSIPENGGNSLFLDILAIQAMIFIGNLPIHLLALSLLLTMVRRLHDVGLSGWWVLVPFYNILLVVQKSDGDNQWGPAPHKTVGAYVDTAIKAVGKTIDEL